MGESLGFSHGTSAKHCNPGKESLKAALMPDKTDYLYYILKEDKSHYFTNEYNDFLNKKKELGY